MNEKCEQEEQFDDALTALESQFATPVVPGELESWIAPARDAAARLRTAFETRHHTLHEPQLDEIARQDAEQLPRVEKLRDAASDLFGRFEQLQRMLTAIATPTEKIDDRESKMHAAIEKVSAGGLALAIDLRKLDKEIATWFVEAFQRDRGVAD